MFVLSGKRLVPGQKRLRGTLEGSGSETTIERDLDPTKIFPDVQHGVFCGIIWSLKLFNFRKASENYYR
jgi:hypothetical protein